MDKLVEAEEADQVNADHNVRGADNAVTNRNLLPTLRLIPHSFRRYTPPDEHGIQERLEAEGVERMNADRNVRGADNGVTNRNPPITLRLFGHSFRPHDHRIQERLEAEEVERINADRNVRGADNSVINRNSPITLRLFCHSFRPHDNRSQELSEADEVERINSHRSISNAYNDVTNRTQPRTLGLFPLSPGHFSPVYQHHEDEELERIDPDRQTADESPLFPTLDLFPLFPRSHDSENWLRRKRHHDDPNHDWNISDFTSPDYGRAFHDRNAHDRTGHAYREKKKAKRTQKALDPDTKKVWSAMLSLGPPKQTSLDPSTKREWGAMLSLGLPQPTTPRMEPRRTRVEPRMNEEPAHAEAEREHRMNEEPSHAEVEREPARRRVVIYRKALSLTDATSRHNRLLVYKELRESLGVPDPATLPTHSVRTPMVDEIDGRDIDFEFTYWSYAANYVLKGFGKYVRKHHLAKGDIVVISMDEDLRKLFITFEKYQPYLPSPD